MIGTMLGSALISFLFMVALMYLCVRTAKYDYWALPTILCSSAICAISLLTLMGNYLYELGFR